MSLRLLLGVLAPGPPDQQNSWEFNVYQSENDINTTMQIIDFQSAAKFHIGMLSISLIIGLPFGGFTAYTFWMEKRPVLGYVISLVFALVFRTFFTILFDGVILLGSLLNVGGGNTLSAFEQICINLVWAFWLTLTIYLHARVQRNFNSEPTLNLYKYGIPGAAVFFAFIWIFLLQAELSAEVWWLRLGPFTQWVVNGFNLLCLLLQLALVGDIVRMMMKTSLDNDSASYLRKIAVLMGVLVFIFWLHLGLYIGRVPLKNSSSYTYFFYCIDGLECALVCPVLYFFNNWVQKLMYSRSRVLSTENSSSSTAEMLAGSGRGIVTVDSVFMTDESGRWRDSKEEGSRDVMYSNVVEPQRLKNILDLYKRLNKIPNREVTAFRGEEFYDCQVQNDRSASNQVRRSTSDESTQRLSSEERCFYKNTQMGEQIQKRNAFYSSKYLILDSKGEIPKYLETRPSVSSMSGKDSPKGDRMSKDYTSDTSSLKKEQLVRKWVNSENMYKQDSLKQPTDDLISFNEDISQKGANGTKKLGVFSEFPLRPPFSGTKDEKHSTTKTKFWGTLEPRNHGLGSKFPLEQSQLKKSEAEVQKFKQTHKPRDISFSNQFPLIKDHKFPVETHRPTGKFKDPKRNVHWVQFDDYEERDGRPHQYLTDSELQERRLSREKEERSQRSKNASIFTETFSSMVNYILGKKGNLDEPHKSENQIGEKTQHSDTDGLESQGGETKMKDEFEKQSNSVTRAITEEEPKEKKPSNSGFGVEINDKAQRPQKLGIAAMETPELPRDKADRPQDKETPEYQSGESKMKNETQFEEKISKPVPRQAKPTPQVEPVVEKKKTVSPDLGVEIDHEEQPARELEVTSREAHALPIPLENTHSSEKTQHSDTELHLESQDGEMKMDEFEEQMSSPVGKPIAEEETMPGKRKTLSPDLDVVMDHEEQPPLELEVTSREAHALPIPLENTHLSEKAQRIENLIGDEMQHSEAESDPEGLFSEEEKSKSAPHTEKPMKTTSPDLGVTISDGEQLALELGVSTKDQPPPPVSPGDTYLDSKIRDNATEEPSSVSELRPEMGDEEQSPQELPVSTKETQVQQLNSKIEGNENFVTELRSEELPEDDNSNYETVAATPPMPAQTEAAPRQQDEEDSTSKFGRLHQYPTYSELLERRVSREKEQQSQGPKGASTLSERFSSMVNYLFSRSGQRTGSKLSDSEKGPPLGDKPQHSETERHLESQDGEMKMNEFEEQMSSPVGKPIADEEAIPGKRKTISPDLDVVMDHEEQPPLELEVTSREANALPIPLENTHSSEKTQHSETERHLESQDGEMKMDEFEEQMSSPVGKPIAEDEAMPGKRKTISPDLDVVMDHEEQPPRELEVTSWETNALPIPLENRHLREKAQRVDIGVAISDGEQSPQEPGVLIRQSLVIGKTQHPEEYQKQIRISVRRKAKPIIQDEPLGKKRKIVSSDSEFSTELDHNDKLQRTSGAFTLPALPVLLKDPKSNPKDRATDTEDSSSTSEFSIERKDSSDSSVSFSLDSYYAGLAASKHNIYKSYENADKSKIH